MVSQKQEEQMSREQILAAVKKSQPPRVALPPMASSASFSNVVRKFSDVLAGIGGRVLLVKDDASIQSYLTELFPTAKRVLNLAEGFELRDVAFTGDPHHLENVDVAVLAGRFGVAENGSVWITDQEMGDRALPFIAQHLVLIIKQQDVVATMADAYVRIGNDQYNYGTFIAGPSKTADIEQSLVLGAHGPKSCLVFIKE
jgi:L-lactate dehydrogenase complex protein LldG